MHRQPIRIEHFYGLRSLTDNSVSTYDSPLSTFVVSSKLAATVSATAFSEPQIDLASSTKSNTPRSAIIAGSAAAGVVFVALVVLIVWLWRRRRRRQVREVRAWTVERVEASAEVGRRGSGRGTTVSQVSLVGESPCSEPTSSIPDTPPQIPLTPGWPRRPISEKGENGWPSASEKRRDGRRARPGARASRLMDDTPFENIIAEERGEASGENGRMSGRQTPSILEAENGSVGHSTTPSRAASHRTPSSIRKVLRLSALTPSSWRRTHRTRATSTTDSATIGTAVGTEDRHRSGVSSLWSWSHRATRSEYDAGGEPLPAYTLRRSQSTTRSGGRSRRSSAMRLGALTPDINPPEYPVELGRRVAQAYPRSPGFPPPPFDGQDSNRASRSQ